MTARDRGHIEEIINHLKRVENDYHIDLTSEMEWLRGLTKEEPVSEDKMTISKEWFEHCKKSWYNEGYIDGKYNRDRQFEEPVSEELEEAAIQFATDTETGKVDVVKQGSFFWGAKWKEQQFEKNRLKHCDSITNEQAELEQKFLDQHLDKYNRMPTFLDAIEYGMRLKEEQIKTKED